MPPVHLHEVRDTAALAPLCVHTGVLQQQMEARQHLQPGHISLSIRACLHCGSCCAVQRLQAHWQLLQLDWRRCRAVLMPKCSVTAWMNIRNLQYVLQLLQLGLHLRCAQLHSVLRVCSVAVDATCSLR
jgi:hypothetical protein